MPFNQSGSKYLRKIVTVEGLVDVYAVLIAFKVTCPARAHAIKKLLCSGLRGKGDSIQDLREAKDAIERAIQIEETAAALRLTDMVEHYCFTEVDHFRNLPAARAYEGRTITVRACGNKYRSNGLDWEAIK